MMRDRHIEERLVCSENTAPVPIEIKCPHCGMEIEIWSDEPEIECKLCGNIVHHTPEVTH